MRDLEEFLVISAHDHAKVETRMKRYEKTLCMQSSFYSSFVICPCNRLSFRWVFLKPEGTEQHVCNYAVRPCLTALEVLVNERAQQVFRVLDQAPRSTTGTAHGVVTMAGTQKQCFGFKDLFLYCVLRWKDRYLFVLPLYSLLYIHEYTFSHLTFDCVVFVHDVLQVLQMKLNAFDQTIRRLLNDLFTVGCLIGD